MALLDPQPGDQVLDACAAPGGKCLFAAARMAGTGRITALDLSAARLRALRGAAARQGWGGLVWTEAGDLREFAAARAAAAAAAGGSSSSSSSSSSGDAAAAQVGQAAGTEGELQPQKEEEQHREQQSGHKDDDDEEEEQQEQPGSEGQREQRWQYDRVLLDAPCTGTGVLAKRADLRWRRTPEDLADLVHLQVQGC